MPTPHRRAARRGVRTLVAGAALALSVSGLAACSQDGGKADSGPTPSDTISSSGTQQGGAPSLQAVRRPTSFDTGSAYTVSEGPVYGAFFAGRRLVTVGEAVSAQALPSLEQKYSLAPPTKKAVWRTVYAEPGSATAYAVADRSVSGTGTAVGVDRITIRPFDVDSGKAGKDATTRIRKDVAAPDSAVFAKVVGIAGHVAVLETWAPKFAEHTVTAVDLRNGKQVWHASPAQALTVTKGMAVLTTGLADTAGQVEARVVATGKTRWTALPGVMVTSLVGVGRHAVVVAHSGLMKVATVDALTLSSGQPATAPRPVASASLACWQVDAGSSVCNAPGPAAFGWRLGTNKQSWALPTDRRYAPVLTDVADGIAYGRLANGDPVALRAGTGKDAGSPGVVPIAVSKWGAVTLKDGQLDLVPAKK